MVADPTQTVGAIPMMSEAERAMLEAGADEWGDIDAEEFAALLGETTEEGFTVDG